MDRRPPQAIRCGIVSPALLAASSAECLEPDQLCERRSAHSSRPHAATRSPAGRRGTGGWTLGCRLRTTSCHHRCDTPRGSTHSHRRQREGTGNVSETGTHKPVCARVSHCSDEDTGRAGAEDRGAGSDAGARRDHRSGESSPPGTVVTRHRHRRAAIWAVLLQPARQTAGHRRHNGVPRSAPRSGTRGTSWSSGRAVPLRGCAAQPSCS
jgi:hypothetical protein